jgi:hypothetical protein
VSEALFIVNPETKDLQKISSVSLSAIGVKERADLEEWVKVHPEILGEPLLVVTSEFDRFDKSTKRLDVLALDKDGKLVVIELKLDLSHSLADQQALRYAAFCSTMTMEDVVDAMARFHNVSTDEARVKAIDFLEIDELPELDNRPRIILAAGALEDQELTSTVLWLRTFGVDITCVELTPFRLPEGVLILVPKTIIPLPETRDYEVRVQKKDAAQVSPSTLPPEYPPLFKAIAEAFAKLQPRFNLRSSPKSGCLWASVGYGSVHYELAPYRSKKYLAISLHLEADDDELNQACLAPIAEEEEAVAQGVDVPFVAESWGKRWAHAEFRLPYEDLRDTGHLAPEAARLMKILMDRTWPLLEPVLRETSGRKV